MDVESSYDKFMHKCYLYCLGPVFGSKNFFLGLAVFFDTYSNANGDNAVRLISIEVFFKANHISAMIFLLDIGRPPLYISYGKQWYLKLRP